MRVQSQARRPLDPLATLDEDYELAVIHIAWDQTEEGERTLLFAFVELLPIEIPPPLDDGEQRLELGAGHTLRVLRLVVSARESLAWYLDCRRGLFALPDDTGALTPVDARVIDVVLGEEPAWPSLICASTRHAIPFCPGGYGQPRVHHLVARADFPLGSLWPARGLAQRATQWLDDHLHFSLDKYPEYWGSVHLIAPNPVYRAVGMHLFPTTAGDSVLVRFHPRAGRSLDDLELILTECESWGILDVRRVAVESPVIRIDFGRTVRRAKEEVVDPRRGVLSATPDGPFIRSINGREIRPRVQMPEPSQTDEAPYVTSATERVQKAHYEREALAQTARRIELFDARASALEVLREHANAATRDVLVVDPQLRSIAKLITEFDLAFATYRFLTSSDPSQELDARLEQLQGEVDEFNDHGSRPSVEARLLSSETAALQGQFVVLDGHVWMLNAPLHRLGDRGTLMIAAPGWGALRERFERMWADAHPLISDRWES